MDKLIRIVIMIIASGSIPFIAKIIYEPFQKFDEFSDTEKYMWLAFYTFVLNWLIIAPSIIVLKCAEYILNN